MRGRTRCHEVHKDRMAFANAHRVCANDNECTTFWATASQISVAQSINAGLRFAI